MSRKNPSIIIFNKSFSSTKKFGNRRYRLNDWGYGTMPKAAKNERIIRTYDRNFKPIWISYILM